MSEIDPINGLRERIANVLGWTVEETNQFSLATLREMVREKSPKLAHLISDVIARGEHIFVPVSTKARRR